jgi:ribosomal protein S18 acetylase RimI-like enzyme
MFPDFSEHIKPAERADLDLICRLFDEAIRYQQSKQGPAWRGYSRSLFEMEIAAGTQFKLMIRNEIAYLFSICFSDKIIWREKDQHDAIYLHRMVVNPQFRGLHLFRTVLDWVRELCLLKHLLYIRMDTWASNLDLVSYYKSTGFHVAGYFKTPDSDGLPIEQRNNEIVLLEMRMGN